MRVAVASVVGLVLSMDVACAQMSESDKRKFLLPRIRSATDCIAREAARHPNIVNGYRYGDLGPMIAEGWKACTNFLAEVAVVHDNLHGAGTGVPFVKGAYQDDLPRAVRVRLKKELDVRVAAAEATEARERAEQARRETERQETIARLEKAALVLRDRIYDCTTPELGKLVSSAEGAEVLATAAMTICRKEIDDAIDGRLAVIRAEGHTVQDSTRASLRNAVRDSVVTNAVQLKSAGVRGAPPPAPSPAPTVPVAVEPQAAPTRSLSPTLPKEVRDCLTNLASARNGQLVDQRKLFEGMLDLCRPEIEAAARSAFLSKKDGDLPRERERALTEATDAAKTILGMQN